MNEVTLAIIGLFIVAGVIVAILARKDNKIKKLESEVDILRQGINLFSIIVRKANILNVPPKDLPDDFDK